MRAVVQRVRAASVAIGGERKSEIGHGLLVLLGVTGDDNPGAADLLARKVVRLRVFEDGNGRMNLDLAATGGEVLCVSQFTLYGDLRRGNRPSFTAAAAGPTAEPLSERFCEGIEAGGIVCRRGVFGAEMLVTIENDGPVTLILDSEEMAEPRRA